MQTQPQTVLGTPAAAWWTPGLLRHRTYQTLRWVLLGWLLLCALATVFLAPRQQTYDDFMDDLQHGRVSAVWQREQPVQGSAFEFNPSTQQLAFLWSTGSIVPHWLGQWDSRLQVDPSNTGQNGAAGAGDAFRVVLDASIAQGVSVGPPSFDLVAIAGTWRTLVPLSVLALLVGVQPRRATKWAWFWLLLMPLGTGVAYWLLREVPWSRTALARPEPKPGARVAPDGADRLTGGRAFVLSLLAGIALPVVFSLLSRLA